MPILAVGIASLLGGLFIGGQIDDALEGNPTTPPAGGANGGNGGGNGGGFFQKADTLISLVIIAAGIFILLEGKKLLS